MVKIFRGWYRESLTKGRWHRVVHVDSIFKNQQMARTVCGRRIPATECDFDINPDNECMQCSKPPGVIVATDKSLGLIDETSISTRASAIAELKRLLKPKVYCLRIWKHEGVCITAKWESDVSISIYTETEIITKKRARRVMTLEQIQTDLGRFKSKIDCLCDVTDVLALASKRKKKLKGRLTEAESMNYFEGLLHEAEK
jgi:hypothetical protein